MRPSNSINSGYRADISYIKVAGTSVCRESFSAVSSPARDGRLALAPCVLHLHADEVVAVLRPALGPAHLRSQPPDPASALALVLPR